MRSALAEYLLRRALGRSEPGMVVGSAGVAATPGKPADPRTLRFAADLGLDLGGHAARRFTGEMASDFDLIFALDRKIEAEVCAVAPAHRERVLLLGGLTPLGDWAGRDVPDPYLWSDAETDRVFTSLIAASELLARRLRPDPIGVQ